MAGIGRKVSDHTQITRDQEDAKTANLSGKTSIGIQQPDDHECRCLKRRTLDSIADRTLRVLVDQFCLTTDVEPVFGLQHRIEV